VFQTKSQFCDQHHTQKTDYTIIGTIFHYVLIFLNINILFYITRVGEGGVNFMKGERGKVR